MPQPEAVARIASRPPASISRVQAGEQADRRVVDLRGERFVGAIAQNRDPSAPRSLRLEHRAGAGAAWRKARGRELEHGGEAVEAERGQQRSKRLGEARGPQGRTKARRVGHHEREQRTQSPVGEGPRIGFLDVHTRMIDEVHIMHARRTRRHAGEAREATVDVLDHFGGRGPVALQHVLDEVDAPAWGIELVAEQHVGRAGRGAEAAMDTGPENLLRFRNIGVGKLGEGEGGLHFARSGSDL